MIRPRGRMAAALTLAVGSAFLVPPSVGAASSTPRLTPPQHLSKDEIAPSRTFTSPFVAVDPEDPNTVVAAYVELRGARCGMFRSRDGGRTWRLLDASPSPPSYPSCLQTESGGPTQSPIAFGRGHTLYFALAGWDPGRDGRNNSVLLARSTDLGDSWTTTMIADARGKEGPDVEANRPLASVVVDRHSTNQDIVYVGWARYRMNYTPRRPPQPLLAVSTDGGRTFGSPVNLTGDHWQSPAARTAAAVVPYQPAPPTTQAPVTPPDTLTAERFGGGSPKLVLDDKGTLYAVWFSTFANVVPNPWRALYLSRSTDHGKTFSVAQAVPAHSSLDNPMLAWSPLGGPEGSLHLVYESKIPMAQGDRDVTYRRSTDGGRTWSEPRILNDDNPKLLAGQFIPNLSVAPNGRLDAVWWDFRHDPGTVVNDVYLSSSSDNGTTWGANVRVTDRSINRTIGPWGNGADMRQPPGIAATNAYTIVAWDDTRFGSADVPAQDIYSSLVQWQPLPPARSSLFLYAIAGLAGVLLAGLVVTVAALRLRRNSQVVSSNERAMQAPAPVG